MMDDTAVRDTGRLALATGVVAVGSVVSLATYFVVQGPFGTINDVGNAATGILSACLAWRMRGMFSGRTRALAVAAATVGAAITVVGSTLVISRTTGFLFAGLVSSVGFAAIGAWLIGLNRSGGALAAWSGRQRKLGVAAGALMALGLVVLPGIVQRLDDMTTAPWWVWVGFIGWLGIFVIYPAWAIRLALVETASTTRGRSASRVTAGE